jgi:hypothetical protein
MSASPYGCTVGRNGGTRGRVDNKHRLASQRMNAKDFVKVHDPLEWRKRALDQHTERVKAEMEKMRNAMEIEEKKDMTQYQSRSQEVESYRLKRKQISFQDLVEKEFIKNEQKQLAKQKVKELQKGIRQFKKQKITPPPSSQIEQPQAQTPTPTQPENKEKEKQ